MDRRQLLAATAVVTAPSDCVSLDSFLLCHWNHLGFFIVRLPERLSVQPAEQPDQQDDWNRNAN
jgi:hypothetical protein